MDKNKFGNKLLCGLYYLEIEKRQEKIAKKIAEFIVTDLLCDILDLCQLMSQVPKEKDRRFNDINHE